MLLMGPLAALAGGLAVGGITSAIGSAAQSRANANAQQQMDMANQAAQASQQQMYDQEVQQMSHLNMQEQMNAQAFSQQIANQQAYTSQMTAMKAAPQRMMDTANLPLLDTVLTSPLGDTSSPNLGRKTLLGN